MADFSKLISGYRVFKASTFDEQKEIITHLIRQGLRPSTLFITCCDLRISPDRIFNCNPGELYVIRNIASLVPPYSENEANGIIAAIDYAVSTLNVENIIVLGHSNCDGIKKIIADDSPNDKNTSLSLSNWLNIANEAKVIIKSEMANREITDQEKACEQETILLSLKNLISYPWIQKKIENNDIELFGWHFNIETGELMSFDPETKFFELIG